MPPHSLIECWPGYSGAMSTVMLMLMNSSFLLIVSKAPRTLPATSAEPRSFGADSVETNCR